MGESRPRTFGIKKIFLPNVRGLLRTQSEIGFGITRLLNIDLLPRIKRINKVRPYRPAAGDPGAYPRLTPALRWVMRSSGRDGSEGCRRGRLLGSRGR